jgi:flavin-binding protein dodecin
MLRSAASTVVRSALSSIRVEECVNSRALSATLRLCCSTESAVCFTAAAENALEEARDQLRTVEHLDLENRDFQEAWGAYRLALAAFNEITNKL